MGALVLVEVLDRRGLVRGRVTIENLPATIGRGFSNTVILEDRYVCPVHARLTRDDDGQLTLEDLNSLNGIYVRGRRERQAQVAITSDLEVRVGHTRLRFMRPDAQVPPAVPDEAADSMLRQLAQSRLTAVGVLIASVLLFSLSSYLGSYEKTETAELIGNAAGVAIILALWAGLWALVSRAVVQRFEFLGHLAVVSSIVVWITLLDEISGYLVFLFPSTPISVVLVGLALSVPLMLIYGHLLFASTMHRRPRFAWSLGITLLLAALGGLFELASREEYSSFTADPGAIKSVSPALIPTISAEDYITDVAKLEAQLEDLAIER